MTPLEQELKKMQGEIIRDLREVFETNMKIFDWDIPENDDKKSAELIIDVMQKAMDGLKSEIKAGKYDNY